VRATSAIGCGLRRPARGLLQLHRDARADGVRVRIAPAGDGVLAVEIAAPDGATATCARCSGRSVRAGRVVRIELRRR
jgi:hypothetical protein